MEYNMKTNIQVKKLMLRKTHKDDRRPERNNSSIIALSCILNKIILIW